MMITDWYIRKDDPSLSLSYPKSEPFCEKTAKELLSLCLKHTDTDFRIVNNGINYRGHKEATEEGVIYILRVVSDQAQLLNTARVPAPVIRQLISPKLCDGGLVLVIGAPGSGKTTSMASTIVTRLKKFGGVAWCIEDPIEIKMQGVHGRGHCWQKRVYQSEFAQAMRDVVRCYPVKQSAMLLVGEVRDEETARECINAANNGILVLTTIHADSIPGAVDRLIRLAGSSNLEQSRNIMANCLRLAVRQYRVREQEKVYFESLMQDQKTGAIVSAIRSGNTEQLWTEIKRQQSLIKLGNVSC